MLKRCLKCKKAKELTEFRKNKRSKDSLTSWCRQCLYMELQKLRKTGYFTFGKGGFERLKRNARKRKLSFRITEEVLRRWWFLKEDRCYYCGMTIEEFITLRDFILFYNGANYDIAKFKKIFFSPKHTKVDQMTIDRLDNGRGYELNNMVKSCFFCNLMKGRYLSAEDMKLVSPGIIQRLRAEIAKRKEERKNKDLQNEKNLVGVCIL